MSEFQNVNVAFRCPASFKAKMKAYAEANDQHLSTFIRNACTEVLRREMPTFRPVIPSAADIEKQLGEIIR